MNSICNEFGDFLCVVSRHCEIDSIIYDFSDFLTDIDFFIE
jgi:hypothetical protein